MSFLCTNSLLFPGAIVRFPSPVSLGIVYPSAPDCFVSKSQTTVAPCLFPAAMSVGECCLGRSRMAACVARKSSAGQTVLRYGADCGAGNGLQEGVRGSAGGVRARSVPKNTVGKAGIYVAQVSPYAYPALFRDFRLSKFRKKPCRRSSLFFNRDRPSEPKILRAVAAQTGCRLCRSGTGLWHYARQCLCHILPL